MDNPKEILFCFANGVTAFCRDGEQVAKLQVPWLRLLGKFLEENGVNLENLEVNLPSGDKAQFFKIPDENRWNWRIL